MKLQRCQLFSRLFVLVAALWGTALSAQITIVISPVTGNDYAYQISVSGTGSITAISSGSGHFNLDGNAFLLSPSSATGLVFGGSSVTDNVPDDPDVYLFSVSDTLASGSSYSFVTGSAIAAASAGYTNTFNPGTYDIISSGGIFGNGASGTFTISTVPVSAVPEPGTYALMAGLATLGFVAWRRRQATPGRPA
ncbi:MAG: PEP-CTERM sorting domain-containing protein [Cephaloticoccus sp.]|nr:PEP-CTERM sorting domain-containing protein [Cephaloticoccus sp.]